MSGRTQGAAALRAELPKPFESGRRRCEPLARKGIVLLLAFSTAGILAESLLRIFFPRLSPRTAAITQFWQYDPSLGWSHIPNSSGSFNAFGHKTPVSINSKGFRDLERTYDRDPSKYRIVVLGDSIVWGYGVQRDGIFTTLMEKQRRDIEVINLGVSGYGTDQEFILFQQEGSCYRPDLVVLVLVDNDLQTNVQRSVYLAYQKPVFAFARDHRLTVMNSPVPPQGIWERAVSRLIRHSFALNLVASAYYRFKIGFLSLGPTAEGYTINLPFPRDPEEKITVALLFEIQRVAHGIGAEFLVVLADRMERQGREMEEFLKSRHVRVISLDPSFPKPESPALHLPDGVHWSALGHRRAADRLLKYLEDENLTPHRSQLSLGRRPSGQSVCK